jgi:D,D-heptose 1,7-bisphosphate phosphatase
MVERAVFLDRDNTIIENDGYLGDPSKVKLLPGAATALTAMRALGYRLIVVSNQSGVARGLFNESAVEAVNQEMSRQLQEQAGAYIDASYYCPYHPDAPISEYRLDHDWRKPKCGMLKQAAADFGLDLSQSWMIGDQGRDVAAGSGAGCRTILLRDPDVAPASEPELEKSASPSFIVRTLADAARIIAREGRNPPAVQPAPKPSPAPSPAAHPREAAAGPSLAPQGNPPAAPGVIGGPAGAGPALGEGAVVDAVTEKLARHLAQHSTPGAISSTRLEKSLDELIAQLRLQQRQTDLQEDFSYAKLGALILQILAAGALILGMKAYVTAPVTFKTWEDFFPAQFAYLGAIFWIMVAVALQGMVLALLVRARNKAA